MSQKDNFSGGFFLGVLVGGLVGGIVGSVVTTRVLLGEAETEEPPSDPNLAEAKAAKRKKSLQPTNEKTMETARRSLEDKIAQLNDAIDDVRQQLGNVNGNRTDHDHERSLTKDS